MMAPVFGVRWNGQYTHPAYTIAAQTMVLMRLRKIFISILQSKWVSVHPGTPRTNTLPAHHLATRDSRLDKSINWRIVLSPPLIERVN